MHSRKRFQLIPLLGAVLLAFAGGIADSSAIQFDGPLDDIEMQPLTSEVVEDLDDVFSGGDDSYSALSSDATVATVSVSGTDLTINALKVGSVTITVTATDVDPNPDETAQGDFTVDVTNVAPVFNTLQANMPLLRVGGQNIDEEEMLEIGVHFSGSGVDTDLLGDLDIDDDDVPDSTLGIAVTAHTGNGTWQYLTAGGDPGDNADWANLPSLAGTNVFLLGPSDRIRYDADNLNGEAAAMLTFRLWDGTQGTALSTFNATTDGGSTAFSDDTRTSSLPVDSVQDQADLVIVTATVTGNDNAAIAPFNTVEINDVDTYPSADTLTVRVTIDPMTQGSLAHANSPTPTVTFTETPIDSGIYVATHTNPANLTAINVELALRDLRFQPVANLVAVGSTTSTDLDITVSDNQQPPNPGTGNDDTGTVTVNATSVNDNPIITPLSTSQFVFTRSSIIPFAGFGIDDVDVTSLSPPPSGRQMVYLTVTETPGTNSDGSWIKADGTTSIANTLSFGSSGSPISIETALAELAGLRYVASSTDLITPETVSLQLTVTDSSGGSDSETVSVTVATPQVTSNVQGTEQDQIIPDKSEKRLFENVVITGSNVASIEIHGVVQTGPYATQNVLAAGAGAFFEVGAGPPQFTLSSDKLIFTGAASDATTAIHRLAFRPTSNFFSADTTVQFAVELKNSSATSLGIDDQTTALIVPVNDLPSFTKFRLPNPITDQDTVAPFPDVEIGDADEQGTQSLGISIEILSSLPAGTVADPVPGELAGTGFVLTSPALYSFSGLPSAATTHIQSLVFTPTPDRMEPGRNETVTFRVTIDDGSGDLVVRDQVRVLVESENDQPVVEMAPSGRREIVVGSGDILPFDVPDFDVSDADLNDELTVLIRLDDPAKGFLFDASSLIVESPAGSGVYRGTGSPASVLAALQGLVFQLDPSYPVPAGAPGIEVFFDVTISDRLGLNSSFAFSLLLRIEQVTRVVTNTNDSGPGSLRQALLDAESNDHIAFDLADVFAVAMRAVIHLESPLVVDKNLTITGPGTEKLFVSGDSDDDGEPDVQIFQVGRNATDASPAIAAYLHLSYLTLIDGSDLASDFGNGGAISVGDGSTLILDHAEIRDCFAEEWGGAIDVNRGRIEVSHSLFTGNRTGSEVGRGGGAVSFFSNRSASFVNVTFSENEQGSENGAGGGALFLENTGPDLPVSVQISHCTFYRNVDRAKKGSSVRTNVFNLRAELQNCLLADGDSNPLDPRGAGRILSLGGNVADDDTVVILSQGGLPVAVTLLDHPDDLVSQTMALDPLGHNGGQTRVHALPAGNPALNAAVAGSGVGTDQRDVWRGADPDTGAFEAGTFKRIMINEIQFDPETGDSPWVEIVNPRDSETLDLLNHELWVQGIRKHVFSSASMAIGTGLLVKESTGSIMPAPPGGVPQQTASVDGMLGLGAAGGVLEIRTPDPDGPGQLIGDVVASAIYLASFEESGDPGTELRLANQSVTRNCEFLGAFLPGTATPGEDTMNIPLLEGNSPPIAFDDDVETDENTGIEINVLDNDFDADRTDVIRVESLPDAESAMGADLALVNTPTTGVAISYDPTVSAEIQALPLGSDAFDTFEYVILDYANGTSANSRGITPAEIAANLLRATGEVTVHLIGVNDAPTPQDDSPVAVGAKPATDAGLVTLEDVALTFAADNLLLNDTDPDAGEDGQMGTDAEGGDVTAAGQLRICWVKPFGFMLEDKDPTRVELSDLETTSELGAHVQLILRADRTMSTLTYDPRGSAILDALAEGEPTIDRFSYLVIDPHGAPGIATVCIEVTGVNDDPVAQDDGPFATDEDHAVTIPRPDVLANDTDVDQNGTAPDDVLTVASVSPSSTLGADVSLTAGGLTYDPTSAPMLQMLSKKEVVQDSFTYSISDGNGGSDSATAFVDVTGVNDAPMAFDDMAEVQEDFDVSISAADGTLANDEDIDMNGTAPDDVLRAIPTETFLTDKGAMVTLYSDGSFDYEPGGLFEYLGQGETETDEFMYTATDDGLIFANGDAFQVAAGSTSVFLPVLMNDVNLGIDPGSDIMVTAAGGADSGGSVEVSPGGDGVLYTPAFGFIGVETFSYEITDGPNGFCMAPVQVEVVPASGPLAAKEDRFEVAPGATADLDVLANDLFLPGGASIALTSLSTPDQGGTVSIALLGGRTVVRYTPAAGFTGPAPEQFSYLATAGDGTSFGAQVFVTVPDRAGALSTFDDHFFVVGDTDENVLAVLANDAILPATAAGWTLSGGGLGVPSNGGTASVSADGRSVLYTPASGFFGTETFTYQAQDAFGGTGMALVTVIVIEDGFRAANNVFGVNWNSTGNTLPVVANDVLIPDDGDRIEITFVQDPSDGTAVWNAARSALIYTPDPGFSGQDTFSYEIGAATHPRQSASVTVHVIDRSGQLNGEADFYCVGGDSMRNVLRVLANDRVFGLSGLPLTITGFTVPTQGGLLEPAPDGTFVFYTPAAGFIGTETFTYQFTDGRGGTGSALVTLKAGSIFVGDDVFTVESDSDLNFLDVLANDRRVPGGEPELVDLSSEPSGDGMVSLNVSGDAFLYTPEAGFTGIETFTYEVTDDTGETYEAAVMIRVVEEDSDFDGATVVLTVNGANDAPTLTGVQATEFQRDDEPNCNVFSTVMIGEVDSNGLQPLTVTVVIDDTDKGELTELGGFDEDPAGTYTFGGTAAAATTAIQALCFLPTDDRIEWSEHETTTFTICVDDGIAVPVCSSGTTIEVYNIGHLFGDNWIFGNGVTLSWDEKRMLTVGGGEPFGFPLGGGGTWSDWYTGEWLMYTDGRSAWNAQTGVILTGANGTIGASVGDNNTVPAMIVPKPGGDPNVNLYIFASGGSEQRVHFTEIDLSIGDGAVVGTAGVLVEGSTSTKEGWLLVPHTNGNDYWLVLGNGHTYPITSSGVGTPINNFNLDGRGGSFRYHPDHDRIGVAGSPPKLYIYDFNSTSGAISATSFIQLSHGISFLEFSHDGTKFYVNDTSTGGLYQYDLTADPGPASTTAARSSAVIATQVLLHTFAAPDYVGDMALAPDGMIYLVGDSSTPPRLHRIAEPDAAGVAAQLQLDAVTLPAGSQIRQGLYHGLRVDDLIPEGPPPPPQVFETGVLANVSSSGWTPVELDRTFASMVVIATPQYTNTQVPLVPRIRNATGDSFEIMLARVDNLTASVSADVHYAVVEEGVYTVSVHGIKMEAVRYNSTVTDRKGSWVGQNRTYQQPYTSPVVLGQVLTSNDSRFSVFWARGSNSSTPPSSGALWTGKHIGEDTVLTRLDETVGYIVIEAGTGDAGEYDYSAFVGADTIQGMSNTPPFLYAVSGIADPVAAVGSPAALDIADGGWPVLYGETALSPTSVALAYDEDRLADSERSHGTEQVAMLVLGNSASGGSGSPILVNAAAATLREWQKDHFSAEELAEPTLSPILWGLMADADNDGRRNLEEYALGTNPRGREETEPLRVWLEPGSNGDTLELRFTYRRRAQDQLLRFRLEQSADLETWRAAPSWVVNTLRIAGSDYERIILGSGLPGEQAGRFYRLRVTR